MADAPRKFLIIDRVLRQGLTSLSAWRWDGALICWGLEDAARPPGVKVYGETRIPAGTYRLELRTEGGMHEKYKVRYGARHRGMLWLRRVPFFTFCYIHPGNRIEDTLGCLLPGLTPGPIAAARLTVEQSGLAYQRIYDAVIEAMDAGAEVWVVIRDLDQGTDDF